ncbi:hypothetical protein OKA05_29000 [Luteolibacter arcticus]|uniref:Uncharacterized protein n=1 Tax=Luteolibacter arcticus TaxID=1581411 RepID=A0ABT3GSX5_9BACT|nr:hypothetical protein [Luteolibacter arcticus]MCW1926626.1 hypothetical protein [Luteolibacter arcticus]
MHPLHRWPSFWLGLFVASFLAWAWWDSHRYFSRIVWIGKGFAWNGAGKVGWSQVVQPVGGTFDIATDRVPLSGFWLEGVFTKFTTTALPHGIILISFLALWSAFLAWRWQRMQRIVKTIS